MSKTLVGALFIISFPFVIHAETDDRDRPSIFTLGAGALVMPAKYQPLAGPTVTAGYNFDVHLATGGSLALEASFSPLVTLTKPAELEWLVGLGPTFRLFPRHSFVLGVRAIALHLGEATWPTGIVSCGYAYQGETARVEVLLVTGFFTLVKTTCIGSDGRSHGECRNYMLNPHRYPAIAVNVSWPLLKTEE